MSRRIKVIQVATGAVGTQSLRTILGRDCMEPAGLLENSAIFFGGGSPAGFTPLEPLVG